MSIDESRNCGCGRNNYGKEMIDANNYQSCCGCEKPENTVDCDLRREMIQEIRCLNFAIVELGLYLDTHPDDQRALCLHRKYSKELKELEDKYQKVYGPLTIKFPCNKWRWLEEPWASFILGAQTTYL